VTRAQSHVVGVALLLTASTIALGTLTLGVGDLLESRAATADAERVAAGFDEALQPRETTGHRSVGVRFSDGRLHTIDREIRLYRNGTSVRTIGAGALRFEAEDRSVTYVGGATVRQGGGAWLETEPPIAGSEDRGVLVVGVPRLGADNVAVAGAGGGAVPIDTNVSHRRADLGRGRFAVAVETDAPAVFERYFADRPASTRVVDVDGDGTESVRVAFDGVRRGYLVVHELRLEVGDG